MRVTRAAASQPNCLARRERLRRNSASRLQIAIEHVEGAVIVSGQRIVAVRAFGIACDSAASSADGLWIASATLRLQIDRAPLRTDQR